MDNDGKARSAKSILGVAGAFVTIVAVWWFALGPRSKKSEESVDH